MDADSETAEGGLIMREILFRGKRIDNGEWVEGDFLAPVFEGIPWILPRGEGEEVKVDPETVGQYTGLCDKNGKKIFEGDIVQITYETTDYPVNKERRAVTYNTNECCYYPMRWQERCECCDYGTDIIDLEVIGNSHDNPELLEGEG